MPRRYARSFLRAFGAGLPSNFWKLWTSTVAANLADGIVLVAVPLIAVRLTNSPGRGAGLRQLPWARAQRSATGEGCQRTAALEPGQLSWLRRRLRRARTIMPAGRHGAAAASPGERRAPMHRLTSRARSDRVDGVFARLEIIVE